MRIHYYRLLVSTFFLLPVLLIANKVIFRGYAFENIVPRTVYDVRVLINLQGYGDDVFVKSFLPLNTSRQIVYDELQESLDFNLSSQNDMSGRLASWEANSLKGKSSISYKFKTRPEGIEYLLPEGPITAKNYHPSIAAFLEATGSIQSTHPRIMEQVVSLTKNRSELKDILRSFFDDINQMSTRPFRGLTDALTTLKLREASCNGKSRLFVAYCRNKGLPARLVGGLILENGFKKTSHQWTEVYIGNHWVPFDPLNGHFASIPSNYLELYKGDFFLFSHTSNIAFDYLFDIKKVIVSNPNLGQELSGSNWNSYALWSLFEKAGISLGLLKVILLLPLGAIVVAIARNVIGLKTFGVFLPALIAIAMSYTGVWWGMTSFVIVIMVVSLIHFPLEKLGILYTPKLVIMLVSVVITFILLSIIGIKFDYTDLAYITLFPVVVITITAERFARTIMEEGFQRALVITAQTLLVVLMAYSAMNSTTMEGVFLAFPELFLMIIGTMLILGRWMGLRLSEYKRFKGLIG
jgi:transglutaminase-like putative cysteine protease